MTTDRATTAEKAKAWDTLMRSTVDDATAIQEAHAYLTSLVRTRESRKDKGRKPSPALKSFLAIKFPAYAGTSPEAEYNRVMGRWYDSSNNVDITLTHGDTVIHCNDPKDRTAAKYLKELYAR